MTYRQPFDGDRLDLADIPAGTWLRLSFAISAAAAVIVVIGWLALDQVADVYLSDGPPFLEALAAGLIYGTWILILNIAAATLAQLAVIAFRRLRLRAPRI